MSNGLLNASGLTTPKVTTEEIILRGKPISDAINGGGEFRITAPHSLGDFYFSITSHMPEGVLPLNGSEVSRITYSDLYDYVLNIHNELVTNGKKFIVSEEEWQNISIENNGYVPYYSYGVTDGMFRLPRMSGYLKATGDNSLAGQYIAEGLPNIVGTFHSEEHANATNDLFTQIKTLGGRGYGNSGGVIQFDASKANPIYGNSEHVTPETNTLFVGVWALTAFTQVGTANLEEIKKIITETQDILSDNSPLLSYKIANKGLETSSWKHSSSEWLDGRIYSAAFNFLLEKISESARGFIEIRAEELISPVEFPYDFLVDTHENKFRLPIYPRCDRFIVKEYKNDVQWYRIYNDGYVEQGGEINGTAAANIVINLLIPFIDTTYTVVKSLGINGAYTETISGHTVSTWNYTTTTFTARTGTPSGLNKWRWFAFGFGEVIPQEEQEIEVYYKVSNGSSNHVINIEEKLTEFEETAYTRLNEIVEEVSKDYVVHVDKQVGELYFSFDNYCPDGVIPLDGRLVSRATYADLWEWVQEKGLVKEDSLITTNDENTVSIFNEDGTVKYCSWYGSGDGELTFRVPKINGYLGATGELDEAGNYIAEGLPNITGSIKQIMGDTTKTLTTSGAFQKSTTLSTAGADGGGYYYYRNVNINASASNPIYGNSEHVTPETNTLFVGVWAITASKAAVFDFGETAELLKQSESYLMNNVPLMSSRWDRDGLSNLGWVKADGSWVDGKTYTGAYNYCVEKLVSGHEDFIDGQIATVTSDNCSKFIVDRIGKRFRLPISNGQRQLLAAYKEGTQWYNIYSDGWIEQGGEIYNNSDTVVTVDLLIPFNDTNYTVDKIVGIDAVDNDSVAVSRLSTWKYTSSSFKAKTYGSAGLNRFRWFAKGYGEVLSVSSPLRSLHLYFKLAHEFYAPAQAEIQEKLDLIDNLVTKTDINLPTLSSRWDSDFAENIGWVKSEGHWLNGNIYRDAYDLMVSRIGINDKFVEATVGTELTDENADKFLIDTTAVKFRLPLINGERVLVQSIVSPTSFCDIFSDGFCEQRGTLTITSSETTQTFVVPFNTEPFLSFHRATDRGSSSYDKELYPRSISSTAFKYGMFTSGITYARWSASGFINGLPSISDYNCGNYLFFKLADEVPTTVVNTEQVIEDLKTECDQFRQTLETLMSQGHFVIESNVSEDGNSWYRKYSDGWIEQGGKASSSNSYEFPIPFTSIPTFTHGEYNDSGNNSQAVGFCQLTTSGFQLQRYSGGAIEIHWRACGY